MISTLISKITNNQISLTDISKNLNNAKTPGIVVYTNGDAASMSNIPLASNGGLVLVFAANENNIIQVNFRRNVSGPSKIYARLCLDGTWTSWVTILNA